MERSFLFQASCAVARCFWQYNWIINYPLLNKSKLRLLMKCTLLTRWPADDLGDRRRRHCGEGPREKIPSGAEFLRFDIHLDYIRICDGTYMKRVIILGYSLNSPRQEWKLTIYHFELQRKHAAQRRTLSSHTVLRGRYGLKTLPRPRSVCVVWFRKVILEWFVPVLYPILEKKVPREKEKAVRLLDPSIFELDIVCSGYFTKKWRTVVLITAKYCSLLGSSTTLFSKTARLYQANPLFSCPKGSWLKFSLPSWQFCVRKRQLSF